MQPIVGLRVSERHGSSRRGEAVTAGIPLPEALGIAGAARLTVLDPTGRRVATQVRELSRWGELADAGAAIRWALVDFNADAPANGATAYALAALDAPAPPAAGLRIDTDAAGIRVDTGAASFAFSADRFALFERV